MKEKIESLCANNPSITQAMVADELGVTKQRVSQVCKKHGIKLVSGWRSPRSIVRPKPTRWSVPLNPTMKAAVGEMTVAADLICRGFSVYRCVSQTGPFDLAVYKDGRLLRIEVRCGNYNESGSAVCSQPAPGRYDVLAIVVPDKIIYRPDDF